MAPTKMLAPNITLLWIDESGTFDPLTPTAAAITTDIGSGKAINFSCAIADDYTMNPTDSDTDSSRTMCDTANAQTRGAANYEVNIPFYMEADPTTNTTSVFLKAQDTFETPQTGYWVRRVGYNPNTTPTFSATQEVDIYSVVSGAPRIVESDNNGPIRFEVPFYQQGFLDVNVALG